MKYSEIVNVNRYYYFILKMYFIFELYLLPPLNKHKPYKINQKNSQHKPFMKVSFNE